MWDKRCRVWGEGITKDSEEPWGAAMTRSDCGGS